MTKPTILLDRPCTNEGPRFEERDEGRFCLSCGEMQYDLRDATRREVVALLTAKGGRACGRVRTGPGGEPRFRPEPPPRGLGVLRGAAVAIALAACDSPGEATVVPEPVTASPPPPVAPPSTVTAEPPPPTTVVGLDPPATTIATVEEPVDHSTDGSPNVADHRAHRHRHAPVLVDPNADPNVGLIGSGRDQGSWGGGLALGPGTGTAQ